MARHCERPGCSALAAVAYGMRRVELLVWLEVVPATGPVDDLGVLCRRHADAMIVPRGWTLDDRRESRPRLFRVSDDPPHHRARPQRSVRRDQLGDGPSQQLSLMAEDDALHGVESEVTVREIRPLGGTDADETRANPWRFEFDDTDDLDGQLRAEGPLLSRAFSGRRRTD